MSSSTFIWKSKFNTKSPGLLRPPALNGDSVPSGLPLFIWLSFITPIDACEGSVKNTSPIKSWGTLDPGNFKRNLRWDISRVGEYTMGWSLPGAWCWEEPSPQSPIMCSSERVSCWKNVYISLEPPSRDQMEHYLSVYYMLHGLFSSFIFSPPPLMHARLNHFMLVCSSCTQWYKISGS